MPELRQLHDLTSQVRTPDLTRLADLAERRRRRAAIGVAWGVAATLVIAGVIAAGLVRGHDPRSGPVGPIKPGPDPSPTATFPSLTPEQIREHPRATVDSGADFPATASKAAARIWSVCLDDCTRATEHLPGELQSALEVSRDDFATGAVYALDGSENISHAVDDWYLLDASGGATLVDSRGHRRALRVGGSLPVDDVAGPPVHSRSGLAVLDLRAGVLHPVEHPGRRGNWDWQGAGDSWFWGTAAFFTDDGTVTRQAAVWRRPDGTFAAEVLPIGDSSGGPGMLEAGTPGTLAVVEHFAEPRLAHISTDYGATWQIRVVPDRVDSAGRLPADWPTWPPG